MIRLRNVSFGFRVGEPVLTNASLEIGSGLTLLVGPNGAGKSTLLKLIAGVERPDVGSIEIDGLDLWTDEVGARRQLAYVPEQPDLTPHARITDILHLVCRLRGQPLTAGAEALRRVGLEHGGARSIRELSMGERRRAVLAAAWIGRPSVALLDEPLEAMDRATRHQIHDWIDTLVGTGATVVVSTHQISPFVPTAVRAIVMDGGQPTVVDPLPSEPERRIDLLERAPAIQQSIRRLEAD